MKFLALIFALLFLCPLARAQVSLNGEVTVVESAAYVSPAKTKTGKIKINVAVVVENPYGDRFATYPTIQVTARAADGSVIATKETHTAGIPPKGRIAFVQAVFVEEKPAKIEIKPLTAEYEPTNYKPTEFRPFELLKVSTGEGAEGGYRVAGEVKNPYSVETGAFVTILFRDTAGKLLGGQSKWVQKIPAGAPMPFEIEIDANDIPPGVKSLEKSVCSQINFQSKWREILGH